MITFSQSTGEIHVNGLYLCKGWAGNDRNPEFNPTQIHGKNNPEAEDIPNIGPLPKGTYRLQGWADPGPGNDYSEHLGQMITRLIPDPSNQMFGRSGFFIHGPARDLDKYGQESRGCIVLQHMDRVRLRNCGETVLEVMP